MKKGLQNQLGCPNIDTIDATFRKEAFHKLSTAFSLLPHSSFHDIFLNLEILEKVNECLKKDGLQIGLFFNDVGYFWLLTIDGVYRIDFT